MDPVNPRVDIVFKKIFGVEENKDLLISLINSIVSEEDQVVDVTLLNPYNEKSFKKDKLSILDIKAKGHHDKWFNIEIQITDEADYDKRALYYWAKMYTDQLKATEDYSNLTKVIGIHILNFISISESQKYHNVFHITEKETGVSYFKDLELHTVELKKFTDAIGKEFEEIVEKIQNALDIWSAFLTKHDLLTPDRLVKKLNNPELKKALNALKMMNFSPEEREAYEGRLKWLRIESTTLRKAENKGFEKGITKGLKQGHKEGRKEGLEEGKKQIAKALLKQSLSLEQISKATGLTLEELKILKKENSPPPKNSS